MTRVVHIAAVQPPAVGEAVSYQSMQDQALALLDEAGAAGADIICLPEYLNAMGRAEEFWHSPPAIDDEPLLAMVAERARSWSAHVLLPLLVTDNTARRNTAVLLDRQGDIVGRYDKTHLTAVEQDDQGIAPGSTYPVLASDIGHFGIMTCYDGHFPEVARILALRGAELILFPTLQRRLTAEALRLQVRCRALDNCVPIVRASYGTPADVPWLPGMTAGTSCIVDFEGTVLADAGPRTGVARCTIDLDRPRTKERSYGGDVGDAAQFMRQDRRPETYSRLLER